MTTLILARDKNGRPISRCDARCYNAKGDRCRCACGGANHGEGIDQAIQNTHDLEHSLKRIEEAAGLKGIPGRLEFFPIKEVRKELTDNAKS